MLQTPEYFSVRYLTYKISASSHIGAFWTSLLDVSYFPEVV